MHRDARGTAEQEDAVAQDTRAEDLATACVQAHCTVRSLGATQDMKHTKHVLNMYTHVTRHAFLPEIRLAWLTNELFLDSWKSSGLNVLSLGGSTDAITEAKRMDNLVNNIEWDLMLIGVGLDGHVGSVYPDSEAVAYQGFDCISVVKPTSSSISFSLPTMLKSKELKF